MLCHVLINSRAYLRCTITGIPLGEQDTNMASSKEEGTSAAAEQLSSTSLGESAERKDSDAEPDSKNGTKTKKVCSACGKASDALKMCTACKCVWYCDKDCQYKHHKEHNKECKRIAFLLENRGGKLDLGTEEDVGPLGKLPPQEECPICMRVLPLHATLRRFFGCCGKTICCGCNSQHKMKSRELAAKRGQKPVSPTCAFCRTAVPESNEEIFAQLRKRVELNDPNAMCHMALCYGNGDQGLPLDQAKCIGLLRQSADLGFPTAQYHLGNFHKFGDMGIEQNREEALKYLKEAAEGGIVFAMHNLGCDYSSNGDLVAAMRYWRSSASGGYRRSMYSLIADFGLGLLHHCDLAESLRAFYRSRDEMKSEGRDQYIAHLKRTGEYEAEYGM